ncbi:unnamed protein product [Amoebophrya sp. A120]|nr:unnamed protein product [Amoebophrya sp. A120]|eukprot:GSA120T00002878001.1
MKRLECRVARYRRTIRRFRVSVTRFMPVSAEALGILIQKLSAKSGTRLRVIVLLLLSRVHHPLSFLAIKTFFNRKHVDIKMDPAGVTVKQLQGKWTDQSSGAEIVVDGNALIDSTGKRFPKALAKPAGSWGIGCRTDTLDKIEATAERVTLFWKSNDADTGSVQQTKKWIRFHSSLPKASNSKRSRSEALPNASVEAPDNVPTGGKTKKSKIVQKATPSLAEPKLSFTFTIDIMKNHLYRCKEINQYKAYGVGECRCAQYTGEYILRPEPENHYDDNAIKLIRDDTQKHTGYVPKPLNARVLSWMTHAGCEVSAAGYRGAKASRTKWDKLPVVITVTGPQGFLETERNSMEALNVIEDGKKLDRYMQHA